MIFPDDEQVYELEGLWDQFLDQNIEVLRMERKCDDEVEEVGRQC